MSGGVSRRAAAQAIVVAAAVVMVTVPWLVRAALGRAWRPIWPALSAATAFSWFVPVTVLDPRADIGMIGCGIS